MWQLADTTHEEWRVRLVVVLGEDDAVCGDEGEDDHGGRVWRRGREG
jgi:hypothetical protein